VTATTTEQQQQRRRRFCMSFMDINSSVGGAGRR